MFTRVVNKCCNQNKFLTNYVVQNCEQKFVTKNKNKSCDKNNEQIFLIKVLKKNLCTLMKIEAVYKVLQKNFGQALLTRFVKKTHEQKC